MNTRTYARAITRRRVRPLGHYTFAAGDLVYISSADLSVRKGAQRNYCQNILTHSKCSMLNRAPPLTRSNSPLNYEPGIYTTGFTGVNFALITQTTTRSSYTGRRTCFMTLALQAIRSG